MTPVRDDWLTWLEWFFDNADFGPAHDDVMVLIYNDFKNKTGITVPEMEGF